MKSLAMHHDIPARTVRDGRATPGWLHFATGDGTLIYLILLSDSPSKTSPATTERWDDICDRHGQSGA